ncbi:hypothetical protein [Algoriphagus terrigena]|uniref:hypothetical protein n=1 Tax=Algoriphagus terrigena TaxID=344884 RepID=UPI0003FA7B19|nr:hypothetical protein [Algoriphagus terrigena]
MKDSTKYHDLEGSGSSESQEKFLQTKGVTAMVQAFPTKSVTNSLNLSLLPNLWGECGMA